MCKNAIKFVLDIIFDQFIFYINIYLSIDTQPSLNWTCKKSAKEGFFMMRLLCQRLYKTAFHIWRETYWSQFTFTLEENKTNAGTLND